MFNKEKLKNISENEKAIIRRVKREDSQRVWEIRNHSESRKNFHQKEEIDFSKHDEWFDKKYFQNRENYFFVIEDDQQKVIGYCRLDLENESYTVSIAIDPSYWGRRFGSILLKNALDKIDTEKEIVAEVIKGNDASLKLFIKNNFDLYKEDEEIIYLKYKDKENK